MSQVLRMAGLQIAEIGFAAVEALRPLGFTRAGRIEIRLLGIRIIVPQQVDDLTAIKLARDIATKIESTMQYPGTIKVNVIRETRAVEFAK